MWKPECCVAMCTHTYTHTLRTGSLRSFTLEGVFKVHWYAGRHKSRNNQQQLQAVSGHLLMEKKSFIRLS